MTQEGKGLPDIGIIEDLAKALNVSVADLLTGEYCENKNLSANIRKAKFYVCPICGNIVTSVGEGSFSCCGLKLFEQEIITDEIETHNIQVEIIDSDYYVSINHEMSKKHYISFIAYVTSDGIDIRKLYPEQDIAVRFQRKGHGLMRIKI